MAAGSWEQRANEAEKADDFQAMFDLASDVSASSQANGEQKMKARNAARALKDVLNRTGFISEFKIEARKRFGAFRATLPT